MNLPKRGQVYIGVDESTLVQLSCDPRPYENYLWEKRATVHQLITDPTDPTVLGVKVMDFGRVLGDGQITLSSGEHQYVDFRTLKDLDILYAMPGATFVFRDWFQNDLEVFFLNFRPTPAQVADHWHYHMHLQVLGITKWLGEDYPRT